MVCGCNVRKRGREENESIVFSLAFEVADFCAAHRAALGSVFTVDYESAFAALPVDRFLRREFHAGVQPFEKTEVALLVHLFGAGYEFESVGYRGKPFLLCHFGKILVKVAPLLAFAGSRFCKVCLSVSHDS